MHCARYNTRFALMVCWRYRSMFSSIETAFSATYNKSAPIFHTVVTTAADNINFIAYYHIEAKQTQRRHVRHAP